jgi:hypothetical protein
MSFFQWLPWVKTFRYIIGIFIVLFVAYCIYTKFFKKPEQNTTFQGAVETVNIIQNQKKKFIPFVEGWAGIKTNDANPEVGLRSGLRFEF